MCLVLIAYRAHPRYPLVLAANRDEFHARPAKALHWWKDGVRMLAGRDLQAGGSWLGLDGAGRIALVTNYRDPSMPRPEGTSRGSLIGEFLGGAVSASGFASATASRAARFSGFNLLAMDHEGLGLRHEPSRTRGTHAAARYLWPQQPAARHALAEIAARTRTLRAGSWRAIDPQPEALMRHALGSQHRLRRGITRYRRRPRMGAPAVVGIHRQRQLRHPLQHRRADRQ